MNSTNIGDQTALMSAAAEGHTELVRKLLAAGADIDAQMTIKMTALMWAAQGGQTDVVDLVLIRGANVNVRRSRNEMTALGLAKSMKRTLTADRLKKAGGIE